MNRGYLRLGPKVTVEKDLPHDRPNQRSGAKAGPIRIKIVEWVINSLKVSKRHQYKARYAGRQECRQWWWWQKCGFQRVGDGETE